MPATHGMEVIKRDGRREPVSFDKVLRRLKLLATGVHQNGVRFNRELEIDVTPISQQVISQIRDGITTRELDEFAASTCANLVKEHPDYSELAGRIIVSNHHKNTGGSFVDTIKYLYANRDIHGNPSPLINTVTYKAAIDNRDYLESIIDYNRDFLIDYFGFKTLERSYLLKSKSGHWTVQERPQHMYLRVSLGMHGSDLRAVKETYDLLSLQKLSHASPTLYNSGTPHNQNSSCFHEDTEVLTINEGVKKIKDVNIGDLVTTHTGEIKRVLQKHKNLQENRKIYMLKCAKTKEILVTGNHKFWSVKKGQKAADWNAVEDLKPGDFIGIPNNSGQIDKDTLDILPFTHKLVKETTGLDRTRSIIMENNKIKIQTKYKHKNLLNVPEVEVKQVTDSINRYWSIDEDFAELFGIFLGDGNIATAKNIRDKSNRIIRGINITFSEENKELINFVKRVGKDKFGIDGIFHKIKNQRTVQVIFNSEIIGYIFKDLFGIHFDGKKIWPKVIKWKENLLDRFVAGLISTDGCISKTLQVSLAFSNYTLMNELYHIMRNMGYDVSFRKKPTRPKLATCDIYEMNLPRIPSILKHVKKYYKDGRMNEVVKEVIRNRNQSDPIVINNQKFMRIQSLESTNYQYTHVYTLGVEDNHSYNVEGLICENCFLLGMNDSLEGIYDCLKKCAMISKHAGGIGIWASRIRAKNSRIRGTNGVSDGLIPMLRVFNETARYVNQGGKRKGSIAVYLEPHHADIEDFLDLKKTHGNMNMRALDLFLALWISDLFMKRLEQALPTEDRTVMWSLFCPDEAPGLEEVYGEEYEKLYHKYEREKIYRKQVPIYDLWQKVLAAQKETGVPYICYKDCVNYRNAQMNIGTVKSSNLCAEITLVNDPNDDTISVCNLCAVPLGSFIKISPDPSDPKKQIKEFDFDDLSNSVRVGIENLNRVIDVNFYPVKDCAKSNFRDRPVGLGIVGLYDTFIQLRYPFESLEARKLNREIFECIYYTAVRTSMELAKKEGPYETFPGSPASQGKLQIDLWNEDRVRYGHAPTELSGKYDWDTLRKDVMEHGLRNSTLIACMPTASTAQIIGQTESFECMTYNVYRRQVLSGDFKLVNKYLQRDLLDLGIWDNDFAERLIGTRGSIQGFKEIPQHLKDLYKGAFEVKQRAMLDLAIERSPFVDQTQSLNIFVSEPTNEILSTIQMYAFKNRLKTGQYYLRREPKAKAAQFTVRPVKGRKKMHSRMHERKKQEKESASAKEGPQLCLLSNPDCEACQV